jgi:hypothetical protein
MAKKPLLFFILYVYASFALRAQYHDYGFIQSNQIHVLTQQDSILTYAWAGGMNAMQFGKLDLDLDGIKDLIAFDVHGRRLIPFLNKAKQAHEINYVYAPEYIPLFPDDIYGFMQLIDFNGDGKEDIFTYKNGGIKVYQNISDTVLKFNVFTEQILSIYYENHINLFCTEGDYIVIKDIDGDGDLDILAFWALGKYIDYHKNQSVEKHGNLDYLDYKLSERCWGYFSESSEGNEIILHDDCNNNQVSKQHRHTGSTMLLFDENGSGLYDLVLGDMDYPQLVLLTNGGNKDSAHMIAVDTFFPSYNVPISLHSMPCPIFIDVDNDKIKDLIVSPLDLAYIKSENKKSVWWYKNYGTNEHPDFRLQTTSFLQDQMLDFGSGAYPVLFDIDDDGLLDLFVGNYGYYDTSTFIDAVLTCYYSASIAYFKNIGSKENPVFKLITDDLCHLRSKKYALLIPTFGDLNGDGKADMIIGTSDGTLLYAENRSTNDSLIFEKPITSYQNIDVGAFASPQLFDIDKDGTNDLLIGNQVGKITYYQNTGNESQAIFTWKSDNFGNVDLRDYEESYFGYATPCFFRTHEGETRLFVGAENGYIMYFKNIDNNLNGSFTLIDTLFYIQNNKPIDIHAGYRSSVSLGSLTNDTFPDLIVGNFAGGLSLYKGTTPPHISINIATHAAENNIQEIKVFPNPAKDILHVSHPKLNISQLEIVDICGKSLRSFSIRGREGKINISSLSQGMYFIKVTLENKHYMTKKFIKDE